MGQIAFSLNVAFESRVCGECGISFAAPEGFWSNRRGDHKTWYCPNGHARHYPGESEAGKSARLLREEQERHKRTLARANEAEQETERLKKRAKAGVCPCCNRTFLKLAYHIKSKHPGFVK